MYTQKNKWNLWRKICQVKRAQSIMNIRKWVKCLHKKTLNQLVVANFHFYQSYLFQPESNCAFSSVSCRDIFFSFIRKARVWHCQFVNISMISLDNFLTECKDSIAKITARLRPDIFPFPQASNSVIKVFYFMIHSYMCCRLKESLKFPKIFHPAIFYYCFVTCVWSSVAINIYNNSMYWTSKPTVADSIPTEFRLIFQPARCGCILRVTSQ
jgi:hypothetical protein